jgi:hypothetical protein
LSKEMFTLELCEHGKKIWLKLNGFNLLRCFFNFKVSISIVILAGKQPKLEVFST